MTIEELINSRTNGIVAYDYGIQYKIVKYRPWGYSPKDGHYTIDEWTDAGDIGKTFGGEQLTLEKYLEVEDSYVRTMEAIMALSGCKYIILWNWNDYICYKGLNRWLVSSSKRMISELKEIKKGKRYSCKQALVLFRLVLRNVIDAGFINKSCGLFFYMGFDYYLHLFCTVDYKDLTSVVTNNGLYFDPRKCYDINSVEYDQLKEWLTTENEDNDTIRDCLSFCKGGDLNINSLYGLYELCLIIWQNRKRERKRKRISLLCVPVIGAIKDNSGMIAAGLRQMEIDYKKAFLMKTDRSYLSSLTKLNRLGVGYNYNRPGHVYVKKDSTLILVIG